MKANELMIGDWVKTPIDIENGAYVYDIDRISSINEYDEFSTSEFDMCGDVADLLPVPLTADILKANGIELLAIGDNGVATPPKWRNRLEQWLIHTKWKDTNLWFDRLTKQYRVQDTNAIEIEYVHQLQQVLRLAKIDKEIEL